MTHLIYKFGFDDFAFNVFCNLFSSTILTLILIILFVPRVKISPLIVGQIKNGKKIFYFKIVNKTSFTFNDVKLSLNLKKHFYGGNGQVVVRITPLTLTNSTIKQLSGRRLFSKYRTYGNSIQFSTEEDIETILSDEFSTIELTVDLTHPVNLGSSPRRIFLFEFADISSLKMGKQFEHGSSLETI